jgi:hypothetical protein
MRLWYRRLGRRGAAGAEAFADFFFLTPSHESSPPSSTTTTTTSYPSYSHHLPTLFDGAKDSGVVCL